MYNIRDSCSLKYFILKNIKVRQISGKIIYEIKCKNAKHYHYYWSLIELMMFW